MKKYRSRKSRFPLRPIALSLLALAAIGYYVYTRLPQTTPTPLTINEVASIPATVSLTLPTQISAASGTEVAADITIDTGGAKVTAVQVELTYDATKLGTPTLTQGDFLTDKLGTPKVQNGRIFFVYVIPLKSAGKTGTGTLAKLKFKVNGDTQLAFGKATMVAAIGSKTNMLKSATGTAIQTGTTTSTATPPVLSDIQPAPPLSPTVSSAKTGSPAKNTASTNQVTTPSDTRNFDSSGNFDYGEVHPTDIGDTVPPAPSLFARFFAWITSYFGGNKNDQK